MDTAERGASCTAAASGFAQDSRWNQRGLGHTADGSRLRLADIAEPAAPGERGSKSIGAQSLDPFAHDAGLPTLRRLSALRFSELLLHIIKELLHRLLLGHCPAALRHSRRSAQERSAAPQARPWATMPVLPSRRDCS